MHEVIMKNTFLEFETREFSMSERQSQSCPVEAFLSPLHAGDEHVGALISPLHVGDEHGSALGNSNIGISDMRMCDLAAAANMFSQLTISRAEMESSGHVSIRGADRGIDAASADRTWESDSPSSLNVPDMSAGMVGSDRPPPLLADFSQHNAPETLNWTPKVEIPVPPREMTSVDAPLLPAKLELQTPEMPEAPAWSAEVNASIMLKRPAPPPAPAPVPLVAAAPRPAPPPALPPSYAPAAFVQQQSNAYLAAVCNEPQLGQVSVQSVPQASSIWWYRVSFLGGIALRVAPDVGSARNGWMLYQNEIFAACERIQGTDGRMYLLLSDGRGWAFDDSVVMPHDPSAVPHDLPAVRSRVQLELASMMDFEEQLSTTEVTTAKCSRRKRGGAKHKKNKRSWADRISEVEVESTSEDTDLPSEADENIRFEPEADSEAEKFLWFKEEDFPTLPSN
eukprot:gnl/MRDRNA2_/MRDRNA2_94400_c0_seq1.p1 gnl/MRDRNA2_/MRDRNA2_94400_c0~~gnl/MRDRNA2_/MRDRNA2_94400_c0_seq1.p1  ORF type:complete len:452 (-),score=87.63 gnl/MRDRNA2_/MRDRNA2_94400_c0_seq1:211-1566(-)